MTQVAKIRQILLSDGSLTQRSALLDYGIMALPRRIADLKDQGFPVKSEMETNPNTGQRFARYTFDKEITHVTQMKPGAVYKAHNSKMLPFAPEWIRASKGFFRFDLLYYGAAVVSMAGVKQVFSQEWLDHGNFKITYVGGIQ
jgi:hypothetical protein